MHPNKNSFFLIVFLVVVVSCIAIVSYFTFRSPKNQNELVLYGNVDVRLVDIGFRVAGIVDKVFFEEGDIVKTGDLLTVLDKTPFDSQLIQAEANFNAIEAQFINAEILLKRRLELIDVGGVSQEDLDNAIARKDKLYADLMNAKASVDVAKDQLSYTEAFAPTDGVILTRVREPGTVVNPTDPVYTLSVATPIWVRAYVDEPHLGSIAYGMEAEVYTDLKNGPSYAGKIGFISPMAEFTPKTVQTTNLRTDLVYRLRIYVDNPDYSLKQGMPVTVKIPLNRSVKR
jgi:HlyD family secretion protein